MSSREMEVLRCGTWLYDGCVEGRVRILKVEGNGLPYEEDEDGSPMSPPEDANGFYYVAEFRLPPFDSGSRSWGHATADEAIKYAEEKLPNRIRWESA